MIWQSLRQAVAEGSLRYLDLHFARHLSRVAGNEEPALVLAAALTSQCVGQGDVCLDLKLHAGCQLFRLDPSAGVMAPAFEEWMAALGRASPVGPPGSEAPLILDPKGRCYLGRYWHLEHSLAQRLLERTTQPMRLVDLERLRIGLDLLFPPQGHRPPEGPDWQKVAAALAVLKGFAVISGGPGTGKTRTVTAILALLLGQAQARPLRIALGAPTGKAAARLLESLRAARLTLNLPPEIASALPEQAFTLHRLLRFQPERAEPHFTAERPLPLDLLVVDEASMVDLPLMARLLDALSPATGLILIGDKDQLASVEAGMVLGDICGRGRGLGFSAGLATQLERLTGEPLPGGPHPNAPLADHILVLKHSYRFDSGSGIGTLARAINDGDGEAVLALLDGDEFPSLRRLDPDPQRLPGFIHARLVPAFRAGLRAPDPPAALRTLQGLRVLCAVREGPYGLIRLNRLAEAALVTEGLIPPGAGELYPGRPILVLENDYEAGLFNGDVGLLWRDSLQGGALRAFFETEGGVRPVAPARLPRHETLYATTVHKSQGSEFDQVVLLLPETDNPLLTRELLYTAVTRARAAVTLVGSRESIAQAVQRRVTRSSGLFERLWGTEAAPGGERSAQDK